MAAMADSEADMHVYVYFMSLCSHVHTEHKGIKGIKLLCRYVVMSPV